MHMTVGETRQILMRESRPMSGAPESEDVVEQLDRILASGDFDASPRSRAFIRFIVEETLAGRQEALTQAAIATRVFARREDFDPTVDPIVRIQAGRLRRSLERYYLLSGAEDPVRIELPRGSYVPAARWGGESPERAREGRAAQGLAERDGWPSVVVRLFEVDGTGAELEAAASRLKEQLCLEMGHYGDVRVVRRREIDQLGLSPCEYGDFDLSGRVSRDGATTRITACLLDCRDASQVWAEDYRGTGGLVERLLRGNRPRDRGARRLGAGRRGQAAVDRAAAAATEAHLPYDAILRSYQFFFNREPSDFAPALEALQRVVRERPECGLAWVQLARLYIANYAFEIAPVETPIDEAIDLLQNAVHLDPSSQRARTALASAFLLKGELGAGRVEAERAYELSPDSLVYLEWIGWVLALAGDWERGTALDPPLDRAQSRPHPGGAARPLGGSPAARRVRGGVPGGPALQERHLLLAGADAGELASATSGASRRRSTRSPSCCSGSPTSRAAGAR